mmetsp:Transcript_18770/g.31999  ORF Transcript_18770/g.31999 Transcript_18770/m.31999 type:complete len:89 (-) Transcript_18770:1608-1874(-)
MHSPVILILLASITQPFGATPNAQNPNCRLMPSYVRSLHLSELSREGEAFGGSEVQESVSAWPAEFVLQQDSPPHRERAVWAAALQAC